ncbi:benzoate/H(+) symporter BenE family transporter [Escherichia coli]
MATPVQRQNLASSDCRRATTAQISGWMTALGLAMGVSTLTLHDGIAYLLTPHGSTPGAALLVTGLQGCRLTKPSAFLLSPTR